ncbi:MAG: hypothetical protein JO142_17360 [Burkholderiales bacterium]|nr:hypothetical protein [Burkholderiales bacterium]
MTSTLLERRPHATCDTRLIEPQVYWTGERGTRVEVEGFINANGAPTPQIQLHANYCKDIKSNAESSRFD